jgi:hypothetical protein
MREKSYRRARRMGDLGSPTESQRGLRREAGTPPAGKQNAQNLSAWAWQNTEDDEIDAGTNQKC